MYRKFALVSVALALMASTAIAQESDNQATDQTGTSLSTQLASPPALPVALENADGTFVYVGKVAGLDAWKDAGGMNVPLFFAAPDGQTVINGIPYNPMGDDIGIIHMQRVVEALSGGEETSEGAAEASPALAGQPSDFLIQDVETDEGEAPDDQSSAPDNPFRLSMPAEQSSATSLSAAAGDVGDTLFADMPEETFWFIVGDSTAPAVYAFIDPSCPYCGQAMAKISEQVEGGEIHLRVILVPFRNRTAIDLAAAILTAEEPPVEFWRHEISVGRTGQPGIEPIDATVLGMEGLSMLEGNVDWMRDKEVAGAPFFAWQEGGDWRTAFGISEPEIFADAEAQPLPENGWMHFPPGSAFAQ